MGPFGIGPSDNDEFLPVETFRFAPQAAIARSVGRGGRLRYNALKPQLAGMAADKLAVANLMTIELQTGNPGDDRFEQRLTLRDTTG